jgi:hypothetical protein
VPLPYELQSKSAQAWFYGGLFDVDNPAFFNPFKPPSHPPTLTSFCAPIPTNRHIPTPATPQRFALPKNFPDVLAGSPSALTFPQTHYAFSTSLAPQCCSGRDIIQEYRQALIQASVRLTGCTPNSSIAQDVLPSDTVAAPKRSGKGRVQGSHNVNEIHSYPTLSPTLLTRTSSTLVTTLPAAKLQLATTECTCTRHKLQKAVTRCLGGKVMVPRSRVSLPRLHRTASPLPPQPLCDLSRILPDVDSLHSTIHSTASDTADFVRQQSCDSDPWHVSVHGQHAPRAAESGAEGESRTACKEDRVIQESMRLLPSGCELSLGSQTGASHESSLRKGSPSSSMGSELARMRIHCKVW